MALIELLLSWIHDPTLLIQAGGYVGIGLAIFAESGVLVGLFLPGDSLLFAAGVLAGGGLLSIWILVPVIVAAAILGDSAGYWFGRRVGTALFTREDSRFFKQEYVHRTQKFYEKYGGRAVILARFVPIVRTLAPILAGVGAMHYRTFLSYNVIGAFVWGAGVTLLGYFLGILIPDAEHYLLPISVVIIIASFLPIVINLLRGKSLE
jgi:membrane-associated protein